MAPVAFPGLGFLGHQAATDVMAVMELKGTRDYRGRLDLRDLLVIWDLLV